LIDTLRFGGADMDRYAGNEGRVRHRAADRQRIDEATDARIADATRCAARARRRAATEKVPGKGQSAISRGRQSIEVHAISSADTTVARHGSRNTRRHRAYWHHVPAVAEALSVEGTEGRQEALDRGANIDGAGARTGTDSDRVEQDLGTTRIDL